MYTDRYAPPPGNNLAAYRRTQDGHGGRSAEHREEMRQIAEAAIKELVPNMAMQIYADTIQDMLNALRYDIETIVNISFDDAHDIFTSKRVRKYVSDKITREVIEHIDNMKIPGVTIR